MDNSGLDHCFTAQRLARIRAICPGLIIGQTRLITEGLINDVIVVNEQLVFRFAKDECGAKVMAVEAALLERIAAQLPLAVPKPFHTGAGEMAYPLLPGVPFTREILYAQSAARQQVLADQLGGFLHALHRIPLDEHSQPTLAPTRHDQWLDLRQRMEIKLSPLLLPFQASWMRRLLSYVDEASHFDFLPCLIHGDLACYHLLYDPATTRLSGVIDFGVAGAGDLATDLANLLQTYGDGFVQRILISYPEAAAYLPRARFYAAAIELQWVLLGLERGENFWFTAHLGGARDFERENFSP